MIYEIEHFIELIDSNYDYDDEMAQEIRNLLVELKMREEHLNHD